MELEIWEHARDELGEFLWLEKELKTTFRKVLDDVWRVTLFISSTNLQLNTQHRRNPAILCLVKHICKSRVEIRWQLRPMSAISHAQLAPRGFGFLQSTSQNHLRCPNGVQQDISSGSID
jgi:hypothetical protein